MRKKHVLSSHVLGNAVSYNAYQFCKRICRNKETFFSEELPKKQGIVCIKTTDNWLLQRFSIQNYNEKQTESVLCAKTTGEETISQPRNSFASTTTKKEFLPMVNCLVKDWKKKKTPLKKVTV